MPPKTAPQSQIVGKNSKTSISSPGSLKTPPKKGRKHKQDYTSVDTMSSDTPSPTYGSSARADDVVVQVANTASAGTSPTGADSPGGGAKFKENLNPMYSQNPGSEPLAPQSPTREQLLPQRQEVGGPKGFVEWMLLFPLVVWTWDAWEDLVEMIWKDVKWAQLLTFAATVLVTGYTLYLLERRLQDNLLAQASARELQPPSATANTTGQGDQVNSRSSSNEPPNCHRDCHFRGRSKLVGFLGILCTTSAWCVLEKMVELAFPKTHKLGPYSVLCVTNAALIVVYEKTHKIDLFAKLEELM